MRDMGFLIWLHANWFTLLQSLGIVGGLVFTGTSLRIDTTVRRVANGFELTKQHREIWMQLYSRPDLKRVLDPATDLHATVISDEEEMFVNFLILHLANAYRAMKAGVFLLPDELHQDVTAFFSLPIPKAVWERTRRFRNKDFSEFVEGQRKQTVMGFKQGRA